MADAPVLEEGCAFGWPVAGQRFRTAAFATLPYGWVPVLTLSAAGSVWSPGKCELEE